jgi:hypothetical protein
MEPEISIMSWKAKSLWNIAQTSPTSKHFKKK